MSVLFILVLLIENEIIHEGILPAVAEDSCYSNWDCDTTHACCKGDLNTRWVDNNTRDEFHCRPRPWEYSPSDRSCSGFYCTRLSDCGFLKDGRRLCCVLNECQLCELCFDNKVCNSSLACCGRGWWGEPSVCSESCLGEVCQRASQCAHDECCLSNRCSNCSDLGCKDHENCPAKQYCCDPWNTFGNRSCKSSCVAEGCSVSEDCVYPEYCERNQCRLSTKCETSADCKNGSYKCCPLKSNRSVKLCALDCDNLCIKDEDCGPPKLPRQCCYGNSCNRCYYSCTSSSQCSNDYCCNTNNICSDTECFEEACVVTSDCIKPGRFCRKGICDITQQCNSSIDCITSNGEQYQCCYNGNPPYYCGTPNDCHLADLDEHENPSGANHFPNWLFGLLGGCLVLVLVVTIRCYFLRKKRQLSSENAVPDIALSGGSGEREQNTANEIQVRFEHDEPNALPPPYIPNNPIASHGNVYDCPNVPPPPYSFDGEIVPPECNNDPPPQYRLLQF